jgi:ATP-dependent RNA helicase RhlE
MAVSFCDSEERPYLNDIQKLIKITLPVVREHEFVSSIPMNAAAVKAQQSRPTPRGRFTNQKTSYNRTAAKR